MKRTILLVICATAIVKCREPRFFLRWPNSEQTDQHGRRIGSDSDANRNNNIISLFFQSFAPLSMPTTYSENPPDKKEELNEIVWPVCDRANATNLQETTDIQCGTPNRTPRIVRGVMADFNEYPWIASIFIKDKYFCGGSLINDRYVVTAAHCVEGFKRYPQIMHVVLGDHHRFVDEGTELRRKVRRIIVHTRFQSKTFDNDIALLRLKDTVQFSKTVRPVCLLPTLTDELESNSGDMTTVIGWGRISYKGQESPMLRETNVPVIPLDKCRNESRYRPGEITDNMLCAGYFDGRTDACGGDSGGPMTISTESHQMLLIGLVSWGQGCAAPKYPGVYTRVNRYIDWIHRHTQDACYAPH